MIRRLAAVAVLAAVPLAAVSPAVAATCPPGTYSRHTGVNNPLNGDGIHYCMIWTP